MTDVYLIPGITFPIERTGWDGDEYWAALMSAFTAWGWPGKLLRAGWSAGDTGIEVCLSEDGAAAGKDVPVKELGRRLAWRIFADQSSPGRSTSVVGHSMGGLVVRAALTGVRTTEPGFPPYLHIDAVVTLATAHGGNSFVQVDILGDNVQRRDIAIGSELFAWLDAHPQPARAPRWTVIGTMDDQYLDPLEGTVATAAARKVMYQAGQGVDHMSIHQIWTGSFHHHEWTADSQRWQPVLVGPSPVQIVWDALGVGCGSA